MRQKRISVLATTLLVAVCCFGLFWFWEYSHRVYTHVFVIDWAEYAFMDDDFQMTSGRQALALLYYAPAFAVALSCLWFNARLMRYYRKGIIFDVRAAKALMGVGLSLIALGLVDTWISATEVWFMTQRNADGPMGLRYYYDAHDIMIGLAGLGFCTIGYVTREACAMAKENAQFV